MALNIRPKVQAAAITGTMASLALGELTAQEPAILTALGTSGPMVFGLVVSVLSFIAGYVKTETVATTDAPPVAVAAASGVAPAVEPSLVLAEPSTADGVIST